MKKLVILLVVGAIIVGCRQKTEINNYPIAGTTINGFGKLTYEMREFQLKMIEEIKTLEGRDKIAANLYTADLNRYLTDIEGISIMLALENQHGKKNQMVSTNISVLQKYFMMRKKDYALEIKKTQAAIKTLEENNSIILLKQVKTTLELLKKFESLINQAEKELIETKTSNQ